MTGEALDTITAVEQISPQAEWYMKQPLKELEGRWGRQGLTYSVFHNEETRSWNYGEIKATAELL